MHIMAPVDIAALRLANQHLRNPDFKTPADVVRWFGAMQAQDFAAGKWSIGLRIKNTSDNEVEQAYDKGEIVRTHVMRPTWHFILPEDIQWMQSLTAPQVKKLMGHYNRKLELTDELFTKTNSLVTKALQNHNYLTRQELKKILDGVGIKTDVQRLAHIIMWAELDGLICSGPKRGKQLTYALVKERVTKLKTLSREQALATLAERYFTSHGPAQLKDFAWWSGLSLKDAASGLDSLRSKTSKLEQNDKTYWFMPSKANPAPSQHQAFLLSIFDEYTIAYKDRSDINITTPGINKMLSMGNALTTVIVIDGLTVGTWKRIIKKDKVAISTTLYQPLTNPQKQALKEAVSRYGKFLNLPVTID